MFCYLYRTYNWYRSQGEHWTNWWRCWGSNPSLPYFPKSFKRNSFVMSRDSNPCVFQRHLFLFMFFVFRKIFLYWWVGLNHRPDAYKASALTTELHQYFVEYHTGTPFGNYLMDIPLYPLLLVICSDYKQHTWWCGRKVLLCSRLFAIHHYSNRTDYLSAIEVLRQSYWPIW